MTVSRIDEAIARIEAAMARIADARPAAPPDGAGDGDGDAAAMDAPALARQHEKLREEVTTALGEIDALVARLEG